MVVWNALEDLRRRENARRGYAEVKTPLIYDNALWETSGHWEKFRDDMFLLQSEERRLRPQADELPRAHASLFGDTRPQLPRAADPLRRGRRRCTATSRPGRSTASCACATSPRTTRTSSARAEQIEDEVFGCLDYAAVPLRPLRDRAARSSSRPAPRTSSAPTRSGTSPRPRSRAALERRGLAYELNEGDGAFYGPKIDLHMTDVLGRSWQMGTIQLDSQMPQRFGLSYIGADNAEHTPYMIHRALLGSLERFIGILIEHTGGDFPFWLAPVQVRVLPVERPAPRGRGDDRGRLRDAGFRVELDDRDETGRQADPRRRDAEDPDVIVYGDEGVRSSAGASRTRGGEQRRSPSRAVLESRRRARSTAATL